MLAHYVLCRELRRQFVGERKPDIVQLGGIGGMALGRAFVDEPNLVRLAADERGRTDAVEALEGGEAVALPHCDERILHAALALAAILAMRMSSWFIIVTSTSCSAGSRDCQSFFSAACPSG